MISDFSKTERNRNRIETRHCTVIEAPQAMRDEYNWPELRSLCRIISERFIDGKKSCETRYYLSSLEPDASRYNDIVRAHWGVENPLHWVLDVAFNEDGCRIREKNGAENFSVLRRIALNLLRQNNKVKAGIKARRLRAGWDESYLESLLANLGA